MRRAVALSAFGVGSASPNPPVRCVVLDRTGRPVGEGYHRRKGGDAATECGRRAAGHVVMGEAVMAGVSYRRWRRNCWPRATRRWSGPSIGLQPDLIDASGAEDNLARLSIVVSGAWAKVGTSRGRETWTQAAKRTSRVLRAATDQTVATVTAELLRAHDDALAGSHTASQHLIRVMNLHQTKGRKADTTILLLGSDEFQRIRVRAVPGRFPTAVCGDDPCPKEGAHLSARYCPPSVVAARRRARSCGNRGDGSDGSAWTVMTGQRGL